MYESFYGLKEKPFSLLPDPSFLYMSDAHAAALTMLEYGMMHQAGFTVITGEVGCGKTTLIRALLDRADQDVNIGLITNTHQSLGDLLQWVLLAYGLEYRGQEKVERFEHFTQYLVEQYAARRRTVLIVDEAQNLTADLLEELRMLSNVNADKHQVLQVILSGQPELRELLARPELVQFSQRVVVDYHLEPLALEDTGRYVRHRLESAGGNPGVFKSETYPMIHRFSHGVPRLINLLCDTALVYAFGEQMPRVDAELLRDVMRDRMNVGMNAERTGRARGFSYTTLASKIGTGKLKQAAALSRGTPGTGGKGTNGAAAERSRPASSRPPSSPSSRPPSPSRAEPSSHDSTVDTIPDDPNHYNDLNDLNVSQDERTLLEELFPRGAE